MPKCFFCPYLGKEVELTDEREQHIAIAHPGTLPDYLKQLEEALADPDEIRSSDRDESALLFSKWFNSIRTGRYLVVVTVSDADTGRSWIITAYTARKLMGGNLVWQKN
ncbi:MAG TPA: PBECR2 nuclease fold domain-containing protein [Trichocoleus sp.]